MPIAPNENNRPKIIPQSEKQYVELRRKECYELSPLPSCFEKSARLNAPRVGWMAAKVLNDTIVMPIAIFFVEVETVQINSLYC